jgi:hypothetical protein
MKEGEKAADITLKKIEKKQITFTWNNMIFTTKKTTD